MVQPEHISPLIPGGTGSNRKRSLQTTSTSHLQVKVKNGRVLMKRPPHAAPSGKEDFGSKNSQYALIDKGQATGSFIKMPSPKKDGHN